MDEWLRSQVITLLNLDSVSYNEQEAATKTIVTIAESRIARLVPDLLSDEQLQQFETLTSLGVDTVPWLLEQVPYYPRLLNAIILDIAEEAAM